MRLVVDTNILFSFFWKDSPTRKMILRLQLFAPEFALEEINKYKEEIKKKAKISNEEFNELRQELALTVDFISSYEYKVDFSVAAKAAPDSDDIDFFALALYLKLPLWSNDTRLQQQKTITVASTRDLLHNPEIADLLFPID